MRLKEYSDLELNRKLIGLVGEERELVGRILHHLKEVEGRRVFARLGYSSLARSLKIS